MGQNEEEMYEKVELVRKKMGKLNQKNSQLNDSKNRLVLI